MIPLSTRLPLYNRPPRPLPTRIPSDSNRATLAPRDLRCQSQAVPVGLGRHSPRQPGACRGIRGHRCLYNGLSSALTMSVLYLRTRNPTLSLQMKPVLGLVGTIWRICPRQRHCALPVAVVPRFPPKAWYIQSTATLSVSGRNPRCAQFSDVSEAVMNPK